MGVSIGCTNARLTPGTFGASASCAALSGVRASLGRDLSNSWISSMDSIGVMPQIASGEKTPIRSEIAPISFPSKYTGLPLIPAATPVSLPLPPSLHRITSCFGPR